MDLLCETLMKALNDDYGKSGEIGELRKNLETRYLKYDWACRKYIQRRKDGSYMNSDDAFDNAFYEFEKRSDAKNGRNGN